MSLFKINDCFSIVAAFSFAAMDISSDLTELGRTPVAVISAGVKSILDIPRTLEYLVLPMLILVYYEKVWHDSIRLSTINFFSYTSL